MSDVGRSGYSYTDETIMVGQTLDEAVAGHASARNFRTTVSSTNRNWFRMRLAIVRLLVKQIGIISSLLWPLL